LNTRLVRSERIGEWVEIAQDAGFDFTADDFVAVLEETIHKKVTRDNAISEFLLVREAIGADELSRRVLYLFIGGVARSCDFELSVSRRYKDPSITSDSGIVATDHDLNVRESPPAGADTPKI